MKISTLCHKKIRYFNHSKTTHSDDNIQDWYTVNFTHPSSPQIKPALEIHPTEKRVKPERETTVMTVSDAVVGNLTTIYVAVIAGIKVYGLVSGQSYGGGFVLILSTTMVVLILIGTLTWDVSRKATYSVSGDEISHEICKGGICWHGVAVRSPASQVRFRLPRQVPYGAL